MDYSKTFCIFCLIKKYNDIENNNKILQTETFTSLLYKIQYFEMKNIVHKQ